MPITVAVGFADAQVSSAGVLGVLARAGWFCLDRDVERFPSLAGWRGLLEPAVRSHFNSTLYASDANADISKNLMASLGVGYNVVSIGSDAGDFIQSRLDAGVAMLFSICSPSAISARHYLSRIQLPSYTRERSDFPTTVLEKVVSTKLVSLAPDVWELYSRFEIDNAVQEEIMADVDNATTVVKATCRWLKNSQNEPRWREWLPHPKHLCGVGSYAVNETSCAACPAGSGSVGGTSTACTQCAPGHLPGLCSDSVHVGHHRMGECQSGKQETCTCRFLPGFGRAARMHCLRKSRRFLPRAAGTIVVRSMPCKHAALP